MRFIFCLFLCLPSWGAFAHYTCFTVDHTKVPSNQTDFPMLISVTDNRFRTVANGGHVQHASGYDIYAYTSAALSTRIPAERVVFVATTGQIEFHVKRDLSSSVDTAVCLAYGDSGISSDPNSDGTYGKTSVWDANYIGVYHFPDGTTLTKTDSSANAYNLADYGGTSTATSGKVDGGIATSGTTEVYNNSMTFPTASDFTVEVWLNADLSAAGDKGLFRMGTVNGGTRCEVMGNTDVLYWDFGNNTTGRVSTSYTAYNSAWTYIVATGKGDNSAQVIYLNGSSAASQGTGAAPTGTYGDLSIGKSTGGYLSASFDEVRFSKTVRTANYVTTSYNNQSSPSTFYAMGTEDAGASSVVRRRIIN